jgi:hypothetical protein
MFGQKAIAHLSPFNSSATATIIALLFLILVGEQHSLIIHIFSNQLSA